MPKVSVIIATHNRDWAIGRAVASVVSQDFGDFELLVVDDGSTDQTHRVLEGFAGDGRLRMWKTANCGVSRARNLAIRQARGEWIAFLDSDDRWLPDKLRAQFDYLRDRGQIKIVHAEEIWIRRGVRVNPQHKHRKSGGWLFQKCLARCLISPSAVMIHREVFQCVGLFDPQMTVCEDYDLWLRITPFYEVGFVTTPVVVKYGGHSDQLSSRYRAMDYFRVKALARVMGLDIGPKHRWSAAGVLVEKAGILLAGYRKHQNFAHYQEVLDYYEMAQSELALPQLGEEGISVGV